MRVKLSRFPHAEFADGMAGSAAGIAHSPAVDDGQVGFDMGHGPIHIVKHGDFSKFSVTF